MDDLLQKVLDARKKSLKNNLYSYEVIKLASHVWEKDNNLLFSYDDHGVKRLIYFVDNYDSLDELLKNIRDCHYLEIMTKDPKEDIKNGKVVAKMKRLANNDCRSVFETDSPILHYRDRAICELAKEQDSEAINRILWETFHTEISHLLSDEELKAKIRKGEITLHKTDGKIDAILQAEVMPKKFYINQIVNLTKREVIHAMLLKRLSDYIQNGGKYLYAWVEDKNVASMKFHQKYGMVHDGMWNFVYQIGD